MTISVDLSSQEYNVFDTVNKPCFLELQSKNFIFGKNGEGKSTLCNILNNQFNTDYDVQIFTGLNGVLENKRLNALVLGENNIKAAKKLKEIESDLSDIETKKEKILTKLESLSENKVGKEEEITKHYLYEDREIAKSKLKDKRDAIDRFLQTKAKQLKEFDNPRITKQSYDKTNFSKDIPKCDVLDDLEKQRCRGILNEQPKKIIPIYKISDIDFKILVDNVNKILQSKIEEKNTFKEFDSNPNRKEFALKGLEIHKAGENCSFCGKIVEEGRLVKLQSLISITDIKENEERINDQYEIIEKLKIKLKETKSLEKEEFFNRFNDEIGEINNSIDLKEKEYTSLLVLLQDKLNLKAKSIFSAVEKINIKIKEDFSSVNEKIEKLIIQNNELSKNLSNEQSLAREKLKLHFVGIKLKEKEEYKKGWLGYEIEQHELSTIEEEIKDFDTKIKKEKLELQGSESSPKENTLNYFKREIRKKEAIRDEVLKDTKSTYKLVKIINEKLKMSGKKDTELTLQKDENQVEHYQVKDGTSTRSIDKLSTGEKNIIGFLYFIESLNNLERANDKNKIIIFDDPITSNDDTMQYLIITEIQKLYRDELTDKFDQKKDYIICLTHNAHFYLNVQPHGNFHTSKMVDGKLKKIYKYDKNGFYRIEDKNFVKITSEKDDFNTHYEALWIELKNLYDNNLLNSMLNSMRRIIETYTKFNKIHLDRFYENNEQHKKLFDVNSHSIDDHSMEALGKNKIELLQIFKQIFVANNAEGHFAIHWGKK